MGLFFVSKGRHERVRRDRDYYRDRYEATDCKLSLAQEENARLKAAIDASRKAFDHAVPVTVVHSWTTA